ncbi:MAG TPA: hypothetical protein VGS18_04045, partial [Thermoplasmata archaeon]|nr:hypothetical protein [Thermoplasmata archaeon]
LAFAAPGPTKLPLLGFAPRADRGRWSDTAQVQERLLDQLGESGAALPIGRGHTAGPILERLLSLADRGPTLLVLDDLHLADEPSLDALLELAPRLSRHGLWILATTLPFTGLPEARRHVLEQIARAAGAERIAVDPLTAAEVAEFVQQIDPARSVDSSDLIWWHSQSGGNPSFLAQILRRQEPTGAAGAVPPARGPSVSAAPEFAEYLARQVGELSEAERRTLTVAAVIGREFPFALLLRATGEDEEALTEIVQSLVHHGILQENAAEQVGFVRDDLRGQIDEGLTEAHRRVLHRRTGEALEALGVADEATVYALARHYYLGKVDAKAVEYNRMAGELAARALAPMVARTHFERALECQRRLTPRAPLAELALTLDLAIQLDRLGELRSAEKFVRTALTEIGSLVGVPAGEKVLLTVYLARILADEGEWDEADRLTAALLEGPDAPTSPLTLLTIHRLRGELFYFRGEYDASLRHHDAALSYARAQRNEREVAREMVRRANVLGMIPGRLDEAIEAYHIASRTLRNLGDRAEASYALLYLGVVLAQHGRLAESLAQLE